MRIKINKGTTIAATLVLAASLRTFAIEGLKLQIHCPNVVLSWPSTNGETFLVQYRANLNTNTAWETLTNFLPATTGTNITSFTHSNQVDCPVGQVFGMQAASASAAIQSLKQSTLSSAERAAIQQARESARLNALYARCESEGRVPFEWELKNQPPIPPALSEIRRKKPVSAMKTEIVSLPETAAKIGEAMPAAGGGGGNGPQNGFYRVVRNGVFLCSITNGQTVSDIIHLPVEVGFAENPDAVIATMLDPTDDQQPAGVYAVDFEEAVGIPTLRWDTAKAANGIYHLRPAVYLAGGIYATGPVVSVTVSNRIQIPDWPESFGTGLPITATIASNNAPYQISIENEAGILIRTLTGIANGHQIEAHWDGLDEFGNDATETSFLDVTISYNPSLRRRVKKEISNANLSGQWLVANQNLFGSPTFINNLYNINLFAAQNGGTVSGNRHVINSGFADWAAFLSYLREPSCRNLYFFGHGAPVALGFGSNDKQNGVTARDIARFTGNSLSDLTTTNSYGTNKIFRFVFLDGCTTGSTGSMLSYAFGIQPVVRSNAVFSAMGLPPRAFLGWKKTVYTGAFDTAHSTFVLNFFDRWTDLGDNLTDAINAAANGNIGGNISGGTQDLQIWGDPELVKQD